MRWIFRSLPYGVIGIALVASASLAKAGGFLMPNGELPPAQSKIGVDSLIGATLSTEDAQGRDVSLDVSAWGIDDLVVSTAIRRLQDKYHVAVGHLDPSWVSNRGLFWHRDPKGANPATDEDFDDYLLVHPSLTTNHVQFDCEQPGLGFAWSDNIFLRWGIACAHYEIELVDAKTGKTLRAEDAELPDDKAIRDNEPFVKFDKPYWPDRSGHWSAQQLIDLREQYRQLVTLTLNKTLSDIGL